MNLASNEVIHELHGTNINNRATECKSLARSRISNVRLHLTSKFDNVLVGPYENQKLPLICMRLRMIKEDIKRTTLRFCFYNKKPDTL